MSMRVAFLTETRYNGKWPSNFNNIRTEIAWQLTLNADHFNIHQFSEVKGYDLVCIIFPKAMVKLNAIGLEMTTDMPTSDMSIYTKPVVETLKENNTKVANVQEGPSYFFNEYDMATQFHFYNQLSGCDIIFAHNSTDVVFYRGLFPSVKVDVIPSLMIPPNLSSPDQKKEKAIIGGNFCFVPDSKVLMSTGTYKEIKNITTDENIMVAGKNYSILHKFERNIEDDIIEIKTYGNRTIKCTKNHVLNGIIRNNHLLWKGTRQSPISREKIKTADIEEIAAAQLTKGDFVLIPKSSIIKKSDYNDDLMWLYGFWLAEGNVEKRKDRRNGKGLGRIQFSIHKTEDVYAKKIKQILQDNFAINNFEDKINKGTNSRIICCSNQKLASFLLKTFGDGALNKQIPVNFFFYDNILILLQALFCGDGNFYISNGKSSQYSLTTGSKTLGDNVSCILDFNGIRHSKTFSYNRKLSSTKFTKISIHTKTDILRIGGDKIGTFNSKDKSTQYIHTKGILLPIKKIQQKKYKGKVYNIDVDIIHKYTVDGILVNNCRWYGGFQSYIVASRFNVPISVPSSHCKRNGEEQVPNLTHLPWVQWTDWMQQLSNFKYAVNMMPTVAAGTFSMNCSYWGIPCIGNISVDTQYKLFPQLSCDVNDIEMASAIADSLLDPKTYKEVSDRARQSLRESKHIDTAKWLTHIEGVVNGQ